nr:tegumental antigen [Hymenolepis microstoma]
MDELLNQYPSVTVQQIQIIEQDMSERMMEDILKTTRKAVEENPGDLQKQAEIIKVYAENRYGEVWHVFIVNGSNGYFYSHMPNHSLSFLFSGNHYLIFCTPSMAL